MQQSRYAVVLLTEIKVFRNLLDAILEFMPAPTDIPAIKGQDMDGNEVEKTFFRRRTVRSSGI